MLQIARILKSNGTDGEVLMGLRDIDPEDIDFKEPVFITFDGLPVPFFIDSFSLRGSSKALVRLTGVKNLEDAEELVGCDVFSRDLEVEEDEAGWDAIVGWTLVSAADGRVAGTISDVIDYSANVCIELDGGTLVPLHEDLVVSVDKDHKVLTMTIPEGLLDL